MFDYINDRILSGCHSIADLRRAAKRRLPRAVFDYMDGAAEDEVTLYRNQADFGRYELLPRFLVDVGNVDLSTRVLGADIDAPFILAPTGMSRLFHHTGERAVARAAQKAGTMYSLSSVSTTSIEDIAGVSDGAKMLQLYVWRDRGILKDFIQRARASGYTALCLTVDLPLAGQRERDLKNGFTVPPQIRLSNILDTMLRPDWLWGFLTHPRMTLENVRGHAIAAKNLFSVIDYTTAQFDPSLTWDDMAWMIQEWGGPFAIKGILSVDDARRAADTGVSAVIISNHGGRQLDHSPSPVSVLPAIADAVGDRVEVILDGGIRRGTDVIKALSLGARAVMTGRAYLFGLGAGGEAGVDRALELLRAEIKRNMMLAGCTSVRQLDGRYVRETAQGAAY
ncbi:MAG: alpha-hydroxy acid oxidase [Gammaproteobacteria bacterium]|nr:alpha-hydroxy acid oxidase [Gammaproteobacteria bacterium]